MRIISLSRAATEILAAVGVSDLLHLTADHKKDSLQSSSGQPHQHSIPKMNKATLRNLEPHFIIADAAATLVDPQLLQTLDPQPTLVNLHFNRLADLFENTLKLGTMLDRAPAARAAVTDWKAQFDLIQQHVNAYLTGPTVIILNSIDPLTVAGLWIPELVELAGATCPLLAPGEPHRIITADELAAGEPEFLFIASQPVPSAEQVASAIAASPPLKAVQNHQLVILENPEIFNTPGPRLVQGFKFLVDRIHHLT